MKKRKVSFLPKADVELLELKNDMFNAECLNSDHTPNETTLKALEDAEKGKGLIRGKKAEEVSKKLGST